MSVLVLRHSPVDDELVPGQVGVADLGEVDQVADAHSDVEEQERLRRALKDVGERLQAALAGETQQEQRGEAPQAAAHEVAVQTAAGEHGNSVLSLLVVVQLQAVINYGLSL